MTNIYGRPEKRDRLLQLRKIGIETLRRDGWTVERVRKPRGTSVRRITKAGKSLTVSIRTTQDTYIAFPRNHDDTGWVTLSEVDAVVAVSVDDRENPRFALVHMLDGDDMRDRFDRTYAARLAEDHAIPSGRGVWLSLYEDESTSPVHLVGAGAGNDSPPIARVPLEPEKIEAVVVERELGSEDKPLTIAEAKRRLALSLGVDAGSIKITVEA
jgi:hypothetical protein